MNWKDILQYLVIWNVLGSAIFCVYVVIVFRSGVVYTAREEDGTLKKKVPLAGLLNMIGLLLAIVGLQVAANYFGLARKGLKMAFPALLGLNYAHYFILFLFDTIVIDGLVLAVWRPGFLRLPEKMGRDSMKEHIRTSIPVGLAAGAVLAALSSAVSYFLVPAG
ncbi:MAG: hypothetical protein JXA25_18110 [Anaerolineales bacterium]|nr:hypothetical protein [Anaerolineales bacterium]